MRWIVVIVIFVVVFVVFCVVVFVGGDRETTLRIYSRKEEILLCLLRIGHTHLTRHHLMDGRPAPYGEDCSVPTPVMHVLAECPSLSVIRQRLYPNTVHLNTEATVSAVLADGPNNNFNFNKLWTFISQSGINDKF